MKGDHNYSVLFFWILSIFIKFQMAQSAGTVEYTDSISAEE